MAFLYSGRKRLTPIEPMLSRAHTQNGWRATPSRVDVVNDRPFNLDGDDAGMREIAVAGACQKAAHREIPAPDPGIAEPENNIAVAKDLPAPAVPPGHVRRRHNRRNLTLVTSLGCLRAPVVALPARRRQPLSHLGFLRRMEQQAKNPANN